MPPNLSKPSSDLESKNKQKTVIICLKIKKKLKEGRYFSGSGAAESNFDYTCYIAFSWFIKSSSNDIQYQELKA